MLMFRSLKRLWPWAAAHAAAVLVRAKVCCFHQAFIFLAHSTASGHRRQMFLFLTVSDLFDP